MAATMSDSIEHTAAYSSQQKDQIHHLGLNEMQMERFGDVLRMMNIEAVPKYASSVRQFGHHPTGNMPSKAFRESGSVPCKVVDLPLCGSYHVVFTVEFDDGVKWMLKVSANGHRFDSLASAALTSEARTMQLLRTETTIPIPAVYAFDPSSHNELNVPFILMERINGQPLYQRWFDDETPKASLEHFRIKALQSLAEAMAQLNKFTLDRSGALEFDDSGRPIGLRGAKVVDAVAMWNHGTASENQTEADQDDTNSHKHLDNEDGSHGSNETVDWEDRKIVEGKEEKSEKSEQVKKDEGDDYEDIFCEKGPFQDPQSAFLFNLDRPNAYSESSVYIKGCYRALRMFIDIAFSNCGDRGRRFVLAHPDFDVQNVLVADDGTLCGLIDWDGVASVPREIGCAQYPLWLMRDWVPFNYEYDIRERRPEEGAGFEESSPAELASYRALYAHFMEKEIERQTGGPNQVTAFGTLPKQEAQLTRQSVIMRDLDLAASNPILLTDILSHIISEIELVTEPEWRDLDLGMNTDSDSEIDSSSSDRMTIDRVGDTNSSTKIVSKDEPEPGSTDILDDFWNGMPLATLTQHDSEGVTTTKPLLPQEMTKVPDGFSRTQRLDLENQIRFEECRTEAQETKIEEISSTSLNADCSSKPTRLGWGRKLLSYGCKVAEKSLRRIAKIGHVLETAVEEVAETLAEAQIQCPDDPQLPNGEEPAIIGQQQPTGIEVCKSPEIEPSEDTASNQGVLELEQSPKLSTMQITKYLREHLSIQDIGSDQTHGLASIQHTMKLQDIPARKTALLKAKNAEEKAHDLADKAAIKKDFSIWENIALAVEVEGITLEQLRMNQDKIASWVIDTFQQEGEQDNKLVTDAGCSPADAVRAQDTTHSNEKPEDVHSKKGELGSPIARPFKRVSGAGLSFAQLSRSRKQKLVRKAKKSSVAGKEAKTSSRLGEERLSPTSTPGYDISINASSSVNQSKIQPNDNTLARKSIHRGETRIFDEEATGTAAVMNLTPSFRFQTTLELNFQPEKASGGLRALCSFGTSCLTKIFSNHSKLEDDKGSATSDGGKSSSSDTSGERSETSESCNSSATSLSDDEMEVDENAKTKEVDVVEKSVAPAADIEWDGNKNIDGYDDLETSNAAKRMSSHDDPILAGGLSKNSGSRNSRLRQIVRNPRSWKSAELSKVVEAVTYINADGKGMVDMEGPAGCGKEFEAVSTKNTSSAPPDDLHSNASVDDEGGNDDIRTFEDDGEFQAGNIFDLLGMDMLDDLRLLRMKEGFLKLLERY